MAATHPNAVKFASALEIEAFVVVEPVGRELYGTTTYVLDEAAARDCAARVGLEVYFDDVRQVLQQRIDNLNRRNA